MFEELVLEHPEVKPRKIADTVRFVPSLAARTQYQAYHQALLWAIAAYAVLQLVDALHSERSGAPFHLGLLRTLPLATVLLAYSVFNHRGRVYQWLIIVNIGSVIGTLGLVPDIIQGDVGPWTVARRLVTVAICALAWFLHLRMVPKYTVLKDATGTSRFLFPPEPGVSML
jgi:hypothetical protein